MVQYHICAVCLGGKIEKDKVTLLPESRIIDKFLEKDKFQIVDIQSGLFWLTNV